MNQLIEGLSEEKSMVNPNGKNEKLLKKIQSLRKNNLNSKELCYYDLCAEKFSNAFLSLAWSCGGLSKSDLLELSEENLKDLDNAYLSELIRKNARKVWLFYLSNPLGWLVGICSLIRALYVDNRNIGGCTNHINYIVQKRYFKKLYGDNWFPIEKVLDKLTQR